MQAGTVGGACRQYVVPRYNSTQHLSGSLGVVGQHHRARHGTSCCNRTWTLFRTAVVAAALCWLVCLDSEPVEGFVGTTVQTTSARHHCQFQHWVDPKMRRSSFPVRGSLSEEEMAGESFGEDLDTGSVLLEDLNWRVEKLRLEEQNTQRFLKSRPRFLPYYECRRWVQAFGRWKTEEDWKEWISLGEKRNSYIPVSFDMKYFIVSGIDDRGRSRGYALVGMTCSHKLSRDYRPIRADRMSIMDDWERGETGSTFYWVAKMTMMKQSG